MYCEYFVRSTNIKVSAGENSAVKKLLRRKISAQITGKYITRCGN